MNILYIWKFKKILCNKVLPKWMKLYIQMNSYSKRNSCTTYSLIIRIKLRGEIVIKNPTPFFSFFFKNTTQRYSHDSGNSIFCYRQVAIFLLSLILANSTVLIIWYRIQWVTSAFLLYMTGSWLSQIA